MISILAYQQLWFSKELVQWLPVATDWCLAVPLLSAERLHAHI